MTTDRLVAAHPEILILRLSELNFRGDLYVPSPGISLFRGSPAAFARLPDGQRPDEHVIRAIKEFLVEASRPERVPALRQVFRQYDFAKAGPVRDLVVVEHESSPAVGGQALLVRAMCAGRAQTVQLPPRKRADIPPLPVVFQDVPTDRSSS